MTIDNSIANNETHMFWIAKIHSNGCNPNGDPSNGNRPRTRIVRSDEKDIEVGILSGESLRHKIRVALRENGHSVMLTGKDSTIREGFDRAYSSVKLKLKDLEKKTTTEKINIATNAVQEMYIDCRLFGFVDVKTSGPHGAVKKSAAISFMPFRTLKEIEISEDSITCCSSIDDDSSSNTMGAIRYSVLNADYVGGFSLNRIARKYNKVSDDDVKAFEEALPYIFEYTTSTSRPNGSLYFEQLFRIEHKKTKGFNEGKCMDFINSSCIKDGKYDLDLIQSKYTDCTITAIVNE